MKKRNQFSIVINESVYPLNTDKVLIGSAPNADINLDADGISYYHAIIYITEEGHDIVDLRSKNGTFVNGNKVIAPTFFTESDTLSLGSIHAMIISEQAVDDFIDNEQAVTGLESHNNDKIYIPEATNENQILIDGEYCDILFDDHNITAFDSNPLQEVQIDKDSFIEPETFEPSFDILNQKTEDCIQVSNFVNGTLLEQYYFPIQDGTIYASNQLDEDKVYIDILSEKSAPLYKVANNTIEIESIDQFNVKNSKINLDGSTVGYLQYGAYQIFIEKTNAPSEYIHISSLKRDKAFFLDTAKKFAATILPLLLLLLVDYTVEKKKPLKELSIIYKKPTNSQVNNKKMASTNPTSKNTDTGHKSTKQPEKKISHSKTGQRKKASPSKVAKSSAAKAPSKVKAKTKAYNFNMKANVNSLFSNTKVASVTNNGSSSSIKTTAKSAANLNTKVNGTHSGEVGNMGSDNLGRSLASMGAKGLSSKSGRDTAYIQTETVVLGSMDPELLRKILQQYLPQFRHCYQQELAYNSDDIKGIVDLNFEISASGKVGKIKVKAKDSRFSNKGTNCMADVLAIIDFPKPKGGGRVAVRQPLSFFAEQQKS